jgi:hypothetical protein
MRGNMKQLFVIFLTSFLLIWTTGIISADAKNPDDAKLEQIKKILATADNIRVEILTIECTGPIDITGTSCGEKDTFVTNLIPKNILPIVEELKTTKKTTDSWGTGTEPIVWFTFYKDGKPLKPYFMIGYGTLFYNYCVFPFSPKILCRGLDDQTTRRFRQLILDEPDIVKKLKELGGKSINLDPNYISKIQPQN